MGLRARVAFWHQLAGTFGMEASRYMVDSAVELPEFMAVFFLGGRPLTS